MILEFYKYQGTGNDFIIIDDRENLFDDKDCRLITSLCERKMGVGADGLILLRNHSDYDFEMIYFNSDGYQSSMCGNGGRCVVAFAHMLKIIGIETTFMAIDGKHKARITKDKVHLQMQDVGDIIELNDALVLDTGSPHYVKIVDSFKSFDINKEGRRIRNLPSFKQNGINVNFVLDAKNLKVRTYERGVEAETLSCGTGVVATAIAMHYANYIAEKFSKCDKGSQINIETKGGSLSVSFEVLNGSYRNIWLSGDVVMVYAGKFEC